MAVRISYALLNEFKEAASKTDEACKTKEMEESKKSRLERSDRLHLAVTQGVPAGDPISILNDQEIPQLQG